jgi:hypothetical protein
MATMNITFTVTTGNVVWSRTASIEVDTAMVQTGGATAVFGTEAAAPGIGTMSYSGAGAVMFANKGRGSLVKLLLADGVNTALGPILQTHLPFVIYSGVGTGFTGAFKASATAAHTPDNDLISTTYGLVSGTLNTTAVVGLKAIS